MNDIATPPMTTRDWIESALRLIQKANNDLENYNTAEARELMDKAEQDLYAALDVIGNAHA